MGGVSFPRPASQGIRVCPHGRIRRLLHATDPQLSVIPPDLKITRFVTISDSGIALGKVPRLLLAYVLEVILALTPFRGPVAACPLALGIAECFSGFRLELKAMVVFESHGYPEGFAQGNCITA